MKSYFVVALSGVAACLAVPALAQQKEIADPELKAQILEHNKGWDQAFNSGDVARVLALYTDDAVEVTNEGPIIGRAAIEKHYKEMMQKFHFANHVGKVLHSYSVSPDGKVVWSDGEYSFTASDDKGNSLPLKGYWSAISVREGEVWKDRMQTWNVAASPGPGPEAGSAK
jgi:uncharacterized protein (TIGR02246 family)